MTKEEIEQARGLYKAGYTYTQISVALGGVAKSTLSYRLSDLRQERLERQKQETLLRKNNKVSKPKKGVECSYPFEGYVLYNSDNHKDGRARVHLVKLKPFRDDKFMLLAKYRISVELGRELVDDETVDHKDDNPLNDDIDNLQVLSFTENRKKQTLKINPKYNDKRCCVVCDGELLNPNRRRETCGEECLRTLQSMIRKTG